MTGLRPATRADLTADSFDVAPLLLGAVLTVRADGEEVSARITEVEAYQGRKGEHVPDPGSHARMGRTDRNQTMWGEPGHLYVYLSHGIHSCVNVACGPEGTGDGCLLRAAEIVSGADAARRRREERGVVRADRDLARGPGRLGGALGLRHPIHDGIDAISGAERAGATARLALPTEPLVAYETGPRVGVAGVAGTSAYPWRFWVPGDPTVSAFRPGRNAREA